MTRSLATKVCLPLLFAVGCGAPMDDGGPDPGPGSGDPVDDAGPPPENKRVRFIAIGDTGKGNETQRKVAIAMRDLCAQRGCDFVLMLGDNIYNAGVDSVTDPQWQSKFEEPYRDVELPFYVALGNHDYGGKLIFEVPGIGNEFERGQIEVEYSQVSTKWNMPATYYTFTWKHVGLIVLDTNAIIWENTVYGDQAEWLPTALMQIADKDWKFVAGHHPYRSNGTHGNAGNYDAPELAGIPLENPLPISNGESVKTFFDENVCGIGQVYFSGHDHSRQWLDEPSALCGTQMIVTGAGASYTELRDRGNRSFYEDASKAGFMYVDIDGDSFTGEFWNEDGTMDFARSFQRN